MNLDLYNPLHDRLVALADEVASLEGMGDQLRHSLTEAGRRIKEDRFRLVLVSPFQGGKSTIFDTVCGGRELSPTGSGIKTSACVAEAHYLESGTEYAEVEWRSDYELSLSFIQMVRPYIDTTQAQDGPPVSIEELARRYRLDDSANRATLLDALERARADYERDRSAHPIDHAELLKVGWLVLTHYQDVYLTNRDTVRRPLQMASKWLHFPEKWEIRVRENITSEECSFMYVKKVKFHVHSEALRRLQAVLVDCPGLFASAWDEAVTRDCLQSADAILFLLGSNGVAINSQQLDEMRRFAEYELGKNVFLGFNIKLASETAGRRFREHDLSKLADIGIETSMANTSIFNALLALRSKQAEFIARGERLPEEIVRVLAARARDEFPADRLPENGVDPYKNAEFVISEQLSDTYRTFTQRPLPDGGLIKANIHAAESASKLGDLLDHAAEFVIGRRARSLLLNHGTTPLILGLAQYRGELENRIRAAEFDGVELDELEKRIRTELVSLERDFDSVGKVFANALKEEDGKVRKALAKELRESLTSKEEKTRQKLTRAIKAAGSKKEVKDAIGDILKRHLRRRFDKWHYNLVRGDSESASEALEPLRKQTAERVITIVAAMHDKAGPMLKGLDLAPESAHKPEWLLLSIDEAYENAGTPKAKFAVEDDEPSGSNGKSFLDEIGEAIREAIKGLFAIFEFPWPFGSQKSGHSAPSVKPDLSALADKIANKFFDKDDLGKIARKHVCRLMEIVSEQVESDFKSTFESFRAEVERRMEAERSIFTSDAPKREEIAAEARRLLGLLEPIEARSKFLIGDVERSLEIHP